MFVQDVFGLCLSLMLFALINFLPFDSEDIDLAANYLDNLTKVPRFDMIVMCLSSEDKAGMLTSEI